VNERPVRERGLVAAVPNANEIFHAAEGVLDKVPPLVGIGIMRDGRTWARLNLKMFQTHPRWSRPFFARYWAGLTLSVDPKQPQIAPTPICSSSARPDSEKFDGHTKTWPRMPGRSCE
jgi:hypothetical protein